MSSSSATAAPAPRALVIVTALRVHQWTKNLVLLAGILFAGKLGDDGRWSEALLGMAAYCALSSAGYLVNDVWDAERDRLHPRKRLRPVARGDLDARAAVVLAAALGLLGLGLAGALGIGSLLLALLFAGGQLGYTLWLKRVFLVDASVIAALFVVRAVAGAYAVHVPISAWLLGCTAALAAFLALAKRRAELAATAGKAGTRTVLRHYSLRQADLLVWGTALAAAASYLAYTLSSRNPPPMVATVPLVVLGLGRYLFLVRRQDLGEEPDRVLLTDPALLGTVLLWAVIAAALNAG